MTIIERYRVRQAVERALELDPQRDLSTAIEAAARSLAIPVEAVRDAVEPMDQEILA